MIRAVYLHATTQIMGYPGGERYIPFNTVRAGSDSGWSRELVKFGIETLSTALIL
jgi:hypothetical protein